MPKSPPRPDHAPDSLLPLKNSLTSIKGRLTTLEKQLAAQAALLEQFQAFTNEIGKLAMKALLEEKKRSMADHSPSLTRTLLTARATTFKAVEHAVSRFRKASRHLRHAEQHHKRTRGTARTALEDYVARFATGAKKNKILRDLNVSIVEIKPGDHVDQELMDSFEQLPTEDPAQADTVAEVYEHAFRFRDEHGNEQVIPGEVDVFVHAPNEEPETAIVLPRSPDDHLHAIALEAITSSNNGNGHA